MIRWPRLFALLVVLVASPAGLFLAYRAWRPMPPPPVQLAPAPAPSYPRPLTITVVGDVLLASRVAPLASRVPGYLFAGLHGLLLRDDLTIGNLECAVATTGKPELKQFTFRAHPAALEQLRAGGVDAVSLANNHSMDFGRAALADTFRHLEAAGIPYVGAGRDAGAAYGPRLLSVRGQRVALLAASRVLPSGEWYALPGRAGLAQAYDPTRLLMEVRQARKHADIVLVYLHWGLEMAPAPYLWQRMLAKRLIEAGADAVVGTHPHVLQGLELHRGKPIAYSLGNFVFTNHSKATVALQLAFEGGVVSARVVPCRIVGYRPRLVSGEAARGILRLLERSSYGVQIKGDGRLVPR